MDLNFATVWWICFLINVLLTMFLFMETEFLLICALVCFQTLIYFKSLKLLRALSKTTVYMLRSFLWRTEENQNMMLLTMYQGNTATWATGVTSKQVLIISGEDSTNSLDNLFQCLDTLTAKFFLMCRWNFLCFCLSSLLLIQEEMLLNETRELMTRNWECWGIQCLLCIFLYWKDSPLL